MWTRPAEGDHPGTVLNFQMATLSLHTQTQQRKLFSRNIHTHAAGVCLLLLVIFLAYFCSSWPTCRNHCTPPIPHPPHTHKQCCVSKLVVLVQCEGTVSWVRTKARRQQQRAGGRNLFPSPKSVDTSRVNRLSPLFCSLPFPFTLFNINHSASLSFVCPFFTLYFSLLLNPFPLRCLFCPLCSVVVRSSSVLMKMKLYFCIFYFILLSSFRSHGFLHWTFASSLFIYKSLYSLPSSPFVFIHVFSCFLSFLSSCPLISSLSFIHSFFPPFIFSFLLFCLHGVAFLLFSLCPLSLLCFF